MALKVQVRVLRTLPHGILGAIGPASVIGVAIDFAFGQEFQDFTICGHGIFGHMFGGIPQSGAKNGAGTVCLGSLNVDNDDAARQLAFHLK